MLNFRHGTFLSGLNLETSSMDFSKFSEGYNFVCCVLWQAGVYYVFPRTIPHKIDGDGMTS